MRELDSRLPADDMECKSVDSQKFNLKELARRGESLSVIFFELTRYLTETYAIDKGVLILRQEQPCRLSAVSTWKDGLGCDGLELRLPSDSSLFEQVAQHGQVYTEQFCGAFSGNFYEHRLLLNKDSRSFVVQPLRSEGCVVGLLAYSSENVAAFTMFEEGALDDFAAELGFVIASGRIHL
ncbi:MAG: GAF domain-containing protein [bacterium]